MASLKGKTDKYQFLVEGNRSRDEMKGAAALPKAGSTSEQTVNELGKKSKSRESIALRMRKGEQDISLRTMWETV